jgi:hypothetical protein
MEELREVARRSPFTRAASSIPRLIAEPSARQAIQEALPEYFALALTA